MEIHQERIDVTEDDLRAWVRRAEQEFAHAMWAGSHEERLAAARKVVDARETLWRMTGKRR